MPELPEVHALAAHLNTAAAGATITGCHIAAIGALKTTRPTPADLTGARITAITHLGKHLDIATTTSNGTPVHLICHLARAGWARHRAGTPGAPARPGRGPLALRLALADPPGHLDLTEAGTTKRLAVHLATHPGHIPAIAALGIDPLDEAACTPRALADAAAGSHARLKTFLTDQRVLAGIGNAYSDEIAHRARLSPFAPVARLDGAAIETLHRAVVDVLTDATAAALATPADELRAHKHATLTVHGRAGQPCPRCGTQLAEVVYAETSLQYCPKCQTGGRRLADRRLSRLLK